MLSILHFSGFAERGFDVLRQPNFVVAGVAFASLAWALVRAGLVKGSGPRWNWREARRALMGS